MRETVVEEPRRQTRLVQQRMHVPVAVRLGEQRVTVRRMCGQAGCAVDEARHLVRGRVRVRVRVGLGAGRG